MALMGGSSMPERKPLRRASANAAESDASSTAAEHEDKGFRAA
jgi:hypothetical protein